MRRPVLAAMTVAGLVLALTACSPTQEAAVTPSPSPSNAHDSFTSTMTLAEAKASAQAVENEIVAALPQDSVASHEQQALGTFLTCTDDRRQWGGGTTVEFTGPVDEAKVFARVISEVADPRHWGVEHSVSRDGGARLTLRAPRVASYLVTFDADGASLDIASFSECVLAPEGGRFPLQY
jgi:hypothetical protein